MRNPIFDFFNTDHNAPKIFKYTNCIELYQKTAFGFDPRPWEVPKPENT